MKYMRAITELVYLEIHLVSYLHLFQERKKDRREERYLAAIVPSKANLNRANSWQKRILSTKVRMLQNGTYVI